MATWDRPGPQRENYARGHAGTLVLSNMPESCRRTGFPAETPLFRHMGISSKGQNRHYPVTAAASLTSCCFKYKRITRHEFRFTNAVLQLSGMQNGNARPYPYRQPLHWSIHFRRTALSSQPPRKSGAAGPGAFEHPANNAGCRGADRTVRQGDPALPGDRRPAVHTAQRRKHRCTTAARPRIAPLYDLKLEDKHYTPGSIRVCREVPFVDKEIRSLENLLCALVYPCATHWSYKQAVELASRDPLTGVYNRMALNRVHWPAKSISRNARTCR